jgi:hypothetical protein
MQLLVALVLITLAVAVADAWLPQRKLTGDAQTRRSISRQTAVLPAVVSSSSSQQKSVMALKSTTVTAADALLPRKVEIGNLGWRWITGLSLGALCTAWIFSANSMYASVFLVPLLLAQQEYYAMVMATGVKPSRRTNMVLSVISYYLAFSHPSFHEMVIPLGALYSMLVLLISKQNSPSINEITTSVFGLVYLGYLPSFWIRLKAAAATSAVGTTAVMGSSLSKIAWLRTENWALGSIITWFAWTSIVAADVGAYFFGTYSYIYSPFLVVCDVSVSLLPIYYCLLAFSNTA